MFCIQVTYALPAYKILITWFIATVKHVDLMNLILATPDPDNDKWRLLDAYIDIYMYHGQQGLCLFLCCLMTLSLGLSKDIQCPVWPYFSKLANLQIRHKARHKVSCRPGDYIWSFYSSSGVRLDMYELIYPLQHPLESCSIRYH